jgi:hypothetical protein
MQIFLPSKITLQSSQRGFEHPTQTATAFLSGCTLH